MSEWKGFDSGGTEQLWDPSVLMDMLTIFKSHEPFSRNDANSPIFDELESEYPDITWKNTNADGSFRPIFRKTNPLVKLGLTTPEPNNAVVTPLGNELLAGERSISMVFTDAAKEHCEIDGSPSFAIMCATALEAPNEVFTLADIEFGISQNHFPLLSNVSEILTEIRAQKYSISSNNRTRKLRNLMRALVAAKAMVEVEDGWKLGDRLVAQDIAATINRKAIQNEQPSREGQSTQVGSIGTTNRTSSIRIIKDVHRSPITVSASVNAVADPVKKALLLERATNKHEAIVAAVAKIISDNGHVPLEDPNSFDIAVEKDVGAIIEVKTVNQTNCWSQIRKAVAQLPEYRWVHRDIFDSSCKLVLILEQDPKSFVSQDLIDYLVTDRKIILVWESKGGFTGIHGRGLQEILFGSSD